MHAIINDVNDSVLLQEGLDALNAFALYLFAQNHIDNVHVKNEI